MFMGLGHWKKSWERKEKRMPALTFHNAIDRLGYVHV